MEPVDAPRDVVAGFCGVRGAALQRHGGDIEGSDLPASLGQPDGIRTLATANVERRPIAELGHLADQVVVGFAAPQVVSGTVSRVPELLGKLLRHERLVPAVDDMRSRWAATAWRVSSAMRSALMWAPA